MTSSFARLSTLAGVPTNLQGGVIAIGNFDGVHRGHQAVLQQALDLASKNAVPALVLTFEPHPRSFFKPDSPIDRLTPAAEKAEIFRLMGFDGVIEQKFDASFAALSADEFVQKILIDDLAACVVVTGSDFHFGCKRGGNPQYLLHAGKQHGFAVVQVSSFCDENGVVISSSRVRDLLSKGHVGQAAALLGYHYTVSAAVSHGAKLGRNLGFPTANMALPQETRLAYGIYAVKFRRSDGTLWNGVASFGRRPTVDDNGAPLLETFIFDFTGDLYGEEASVSFYSYLRGEEKFKNLDALVAQMEQDKQEAQAVLATAHPLSPLDRHFTFET